MIDLNHEASILLYYLHAVTIASKIKNYTSAEDLVDLLTGLIRVNDVDDLLQRLHNFHDSNIYHTQERDFALATFITAFDNKKRHKYEPTAIQYQLVTAQSTVKTLTMTTERFHYEFTLDVNFFLDEQLKIEENFQDIVKFILEYKYELIDKIDFVDKEKYHSAQKKLILENSLNLMNNYLDKKIILPMLFKKIYQQFEKAQLLPCDTYGAAFLGIFGKTSGLAKSLWDFTNTLTKKIHNINYLVNSCKYASFTPVLTKRKVSMTRSYG